MTETKSPMHEVTGDVINQDDNTVKNTDATAPDNFNPKAFTFNNPDESETQKYLEEIRSKFKGNTKRD